MIVISINLKSFLVSVTYSFSNIVIVTYRFSGHLCPFNVFLQEIALEKLKQKYILVLMNLAEVIFTILKEMCMV